MSGRRLSFIVLSLLLILLPWAIYGGDSKGEHKYVTSKFSIEYHRLDCRKAKRIQEQNRIFFPSAEEAIKSGYKPCNLCKPPEKDTPADKGDLKNP